MSSDNFENADEGGKRRRKSPISGEQAQNLMNSLYSRALEGVPEIAGSAYSLAEDYTKQYPNNPRKAAEELVKNQVIKCGTTGFLTGLGGLITLPVTLPADVGAVLFMQIRMIAAIAQMGGFDIDSDQVKTLSYACLVKGGVADVLKNAGIKVGENVAINAIKKIPGYVIANINKKLGFTLVTRFGGSRFGRYAVVNLSKMVPVVGGVIGGGFDVVTTKAVAKRAITLYIDKKVPDVSD